MSEGVLIPPNAPLHSCDPPDPDGNPVDTLWECPKCYRWYFVGLLNCYETTVHCWTRVRWYHFKKHDRIDAHYRELEVKESLRRMKTYDR